MSICREKVKNGYSHTDDRDGKECVKAGKSFLAQGKTYPIIYDVSYITNQEEAHGTEIKEKVF